MAHKCCQCQGFISDEARFCSYCGADQTLQPVDAATEGSGSPGNYCVYCGAAVRAQNLFCTQCGASIRLVSEIAPEQASPVWPQPPPTSLPPTQPLPPQPPPPTRSRRSKKPWFIGLAVILALVIGVYALLQSAWFDKLRNGSNETNGNTSTTSSSGQEPDDIGQINIVYTDADYAAAEQVTASVTPEQTSVALDDTGISVDFGSTNIFDNCALAVQMLAPKTDKQLGLTAQLYDFSLSTVASDGAATPGTASGGEITEFATTVRITLPCPARADEIAFLQYYRPADQTWQLLPCTRDPGAGTISCQLSHFSGIAVFSSDGSILHSISGTIFSYVGEYRGETTPVMVTDTDLDKYLAGIGTDQLAKLLRLAKIPADDEIASALALLNNMTSGVDILVDSQMAATRLSKILSGETLSKVNPVLASVGAALVMGRICYQLNRGVNPATIVKDNAFNVVESALGLTALYTGAAPVAFAATAVFAAGLIYDQIKEPLAPSAWNEYTYYYYNRHGVIFNTDTLVVGADYFAQPNELELDAGGPNTVKAIEAIYNKHGKNPQELNRALNAFVDAYSERFWLDPTIQHEAYYQSMLLSLGTVNTVGAPDHYVRPTEAAKKDWKANFRRELLGALQPVFKAYMQRTYDELKQALLDSINQDMLPILNTIVYFEIVDPTPGVKTFDQSAYAKRPDYTIMFGDPVFQGFNPGGKDYSTPEDHIFTARKGSNRAYVCNLYAYMAQGMPNTLDVIPLDSQAEILTVPFTLKTPVTVITLPERPSETTTVTSQKQGTWQLQTTQHSDLQKMIDYNAMTHQITVNGSIPSLTVTNKELHYNKSVTVHHSFTPPPATLIPGETVTVDVAVERTAAEKLYTSFSAGTVILMDLQSADNTSYGWGSFGESSGAWINYSFSGGDWSGYDYGKLTPGLTSAHNTLRIKAPPAQAAAEGKDTFVITLRVTQIDTFSYDTYYIYHYMPLK